MRALLLSLLLLAFGAAAAPARAADPNDDVRRFVNGVWKLEFREDVKGGKGDIQSVATILTITMRYDGTRTITQDQQINNDPLVRVTETNGYYRVDEIDGANFKLTAWSDTDPPQTSNRRRTGADTMMVEGSDAVYQRVPASQEVIFGGIPAQREAPAASGGGGAAPAPAPAPAPVTPEQNAADAKLRQFMLGRWTASVQANGSTIDSVLDYHASGEVTGYQTITGANPARYDVNGAFTVKATGADSFTLTFYLPGAQPLSTELQVVDDNTLYNQTEKYQAKRAQ